MELTAEAWQLARAGVRAPVPIILGSNRDEASATYFHVAPFRLDTAGLRQLASSLLPMQRQACTGSDCLSELLSLYLPESFPVTSWCVSSAAVPIYLA